MGEVAARTLFSNNTGPLAGTGLDTLAKNQGAILELEGAQAPQSKTITDGSISPTAAYVIVDTEGSAAADDLDVINPVLSASENLHDGMIVHLKAADSGRVVTVKNSSSANGINTYDGNDYVLSTTHWLKLQLRSGKWYEVEGRAMETALAAATAAAAASTPATTTARGIGRVATLADMEPGAIIENGPAFLDVKGGVIATTPAAHAVPQADADGTLNHWFGGMYDYIDNALQPSVTGSCTTNGTTDNTLALTGIVSALALEVGDVIKITGSTGGLNDKLFTVESITDANRIILNYEHAGNRGNGSLRLVDQTANVTITRIAKWFNAQQGLGQKWVNVSGFRPKTTVFTNSTKRLISVDIIIGITSGSGDRGYGFYINGAVRIKDPSGLNTSTGNSWVITDPIPDGSTYQYEKGPNTGEAVFWELR